MSNGERCADEHCVTCGDVAEPMEVLEVASGDSLAVCLAPSGERLTVETALVAPVAAGDALLVHAGVAIAEVPATPPPLHARAEEAAG